MGGIPAASLVGVDLRRIHELDPEGAAEIELLGRALVSGTDTSEQFVRLCELLLKFGETKKAKSLLLANSSEGDSAYRLFQETFPDAKQLFDSAVSAFSRQFDCRLLPVQSGRTLSVVFSCEANAESPGTLRPDLARTDPIRELVGGIRCEAQITYQVPDRVVADVYSTEDETHAFPLLFELGIWKSDPEAAYSWP